MWRTVLWFGMFMPGTIGFSPNRTKTRQPNNQNEPHDAPLPLVLLDPPPRGGGAAPDCGGVARQWGVWGGRCGICGDEWGITGNAPHERPGPVGRRYPEGGVLALRFLGEVTRAWLEVALCPAPGVPREDCRPLAPLDSLRFRLPPSLACSHCVLRLSYREPRVGAREGRLCVDIGVGGPLWRPPGGRGEAGGERPGIEETVTVNEDVRNISIITKEELVAVTEDISDLEESDIASEKVTIIEATKDALIQL